jgi:hypothetical protein
MMIRLPIIHRAVALAIALAVPLAIYLVNGTVEPWAFVLGAVIGFSYWYFLPFVLTLV